MTYEIRVYYQMLYGDGEDYYSIADADIINIDLGYSGNSNIDPFEFIGNRASVLVAANARTAFLDTLYTNDIGFEHIVRILNADTNTPIFTGMILFNGYNHNYKTDTYSFEVSDALDVWITKAKQIEVSAGSNSYLLGFFAQALAPYGDLNRWEWDNTYDDVRLTTVPYSRGFPTADFVYVPFIWIDPSGNNYSGIGEDVFDDDEDFTNWRVVSRQCHVQENRITYFVILREFPFNYLNIHMRVVYYTLKIDEDRLIQIMDTGKRGVIRPTQSSNQSAVHNYIKAQLIAAEALPSDVTYANVYATEYQGLEGSPNQGDAIYSLIPKFDTDQDYLYPSGEHIWVDKWGGSTALLNLAKPNLLTKDGTLAEIVKGFCILLGIGMTSLTDGGIKTFPHVLRSFSATTPITITDTDLIECEIDRTYADYKNCAKALDVFQGNERALLSLILSSYIMTVYLGISATIKISLPSATYSSYDFTGFVPISVKGKSYYVTRWTAPLEGSVLNIIAVGGF